MAKIIEFYIPQRFRKVSQRVPASQAGKVVAISLAGTKINAIGQGNRQGRLMSRRRGECQRLRHGRRGSCASLLSRDPLRETTNVSFAGGVNCDRN
jgi:hypothetical protein